MREWNLAPGDPLCLTLSADARLDGADYLNDHTWELEIGYGQPPALALRTSFGLRARMMRLFPHFDEGRSIAANPSEFPSPPRLRSFAPNFLALDFSPLDQIDVRAEYWMATSQILAGRFRLTNRAGKPRKIKLHLSAVLNPLDGKAFSDSQIQLVNVLTGSTGGLAPLLYMTGGPAPVGGPYPSLAVDLNLASGVPRTITWALAALTSAQDSFDAARKITSRPWEVELSRIEMSAASDTLDIETGDPDWDAAFALTQTSALRLFFPASGHLQNPSFVLARGADQGYTAKGDGTDYPLAWSGQTPFDSYYLASLLPGAPKLTRGLLKNFLDVQSQESALDLRPGLAGQRAKMQATPLLASLAWELYQASGDESILAESFQDLLNFFWSWFSPAHDRDRDGLPEWDHLRQSGWEENPLFDVWHAWSQGVDISTVENPALPSMLAREAGCLILIAEKLGRSHEVELIRRQAEVLEKAVQSAWDEHAAIYQYRDRDTDLTTEGRIVAKGRGGKPLKPAFDAEGRVRLVIEVQTKSPAGKRPEARIAEFETEEPLEVIAPSQFQWRNGGMVATSRRVYERVGRVEVLGLTASDHVIVCVVDLTQQDHTLFLPLWAGLPDRQRAQSMIGRVLLDPKRFDRPFGIPACSSSPKGADAICSSVHLPWNHLIGEGLLEYGFREEAARLTANLMNAVIQNLKRNRAFAQRYHADTGAGLGERNALTGLAPLGLFLQTLGVTVLSSTRVRLEGKNPFPWPVSIRYRGLTIQRGMDSTEVTFHNGKSATVTSLAPCVVEM